MKKIIRKVKGKKVLSFVLAVIMLATTFNIALPMLKLDVEAADEYIVNAGGIASSGVTQTRVVDTDGSYVTTYNNLATQFMNGASEATEIVIPGMLAAEDYVVQGLTYYPERDWFLVTAYYNATDDEIKKNQVKSSKVFCLDAKTGEFYAMFDFYDPNTTTLNTDHGGGIAVSENNIYYSAGDQDRLIAYAPLSAIADMQKGEYRTVKLVEEVELHELGDSYTAYLCYDEGILWVGNFYDEGALGGLIAADYNKKVNSDYASMVYGYKLKGENSTEEWANLKATSGTDRQGSPSYVLALNNSIKDVQYAVVDNGKLYLSCSYGTGEGMSVSVGGMKPYSSLIIADIDLSSKPDRDDVPMHTSSGDVYVPGFRINDYTTYDMMPMSEGLCFVGDELFITFEGASNKYMNDAGLLGNCKTPIDVIWKLDPYELMEIKPVVSDNSLYYEKVNSVAEIEDGEEYLIFHESPEKDPVTQKHILYALNADGGLKDYKLSKSKKDSINGYDAMIGHAITDYSMDGDILYLNEPEIDDVESVRWTLNRYTAGDNNHYYIKNNDKYFADYTDLYFNENKITMIEKDANVLSNIIIAQAQYDNNRHEGNGFWLNNNNKYFLWCNEGLSEEYNNRINNYYANNSTNTPIYNGVTEEKGTFHCDATNNPESGTNNIIGDSISADNFYEEGIFYIYKRVVEKAASTSETRVYTDVKTELQADGTYTVNLETYATSPFHYKYRGEKPTDYIFVMDTSKSVDDGEDGTALRAYGTGDKLQVKTFCEDTDTDSTAVKTHGFAYSLPNKQIYMLDAATNKYFRVYLAIRTSETRKNIIGNTVVKKQLYWAYYIDDNGLYHVLNNAGGVKAAVNKATFIDNIANNKEYSNEVSQSGFDGSSERMDTVLYTGVHYEFFPSGQGTPLATAKKVLVDTADKINADANANNLDHRMAIVKYGDITEYFRNGVGWSGTVPTDGSDIGAFFNAKDKDGVAGITGNDLNGVISGLTGTQQTDNSGMELKLASDIMQYSDADYTASGNRNLAIIFITDGVPGAYDGKQIGTAADNVIKKAYTMKQNGAFIYTAIVGDIETATKISYNGKNIPSKTYIEAVSSKYPAAQSLANLGGESVDGTTYSFNLAACSLDLYLDFGTFVGEEVTNNNAVGVSSLNDQSIIRQQLAEFFTIPSNVKDNIKAYYIPGVFDKIGRFSFNESEKVDKTSTINPSFTTDTIQITGYNYAEEYISKGKVGNKLRVTIPGLTLKPNIDIFNENINIGEKTALYNNQANMTASDAGTAEPFKYLPTQYINVPEYTYVLDYGFEMYDSAVNGTIKALANTPDKQDINDYTDSIDSGMVEIRNNHQDLLYRHNPIYAQDTGYVLIQRPDESYDWFKIKVVPGSNVLYEETALTIANGGDYMWTKVGTPTTTYQDLSSEKDVYGYDSHYANSTGFSNGTHYFAKVDEGRKRSDTATFTFTGSSFDLIGACGKYTGMLVVQIGKKVIIVDTFCDDANLIGSNEYINQVPIVNWDGEYGTHEVKVTAAYFSNAKGTKTSIKNNKIDTGLEMSSANFTNQQDAVAMLESVGITGVSAEDVELVWFDDDSVLNGGAGVAAQKNGSRKLMEDGKITLRNYIDGIRVYNPLGADSSSYSETEKNATYYNVIDELASTNDILNGTINNKVAFVTGSLSEGTALSFANYESIGPEGEFYLNVGDDKNTDALVFNTRVAPGGRVMISLRAVNEPTTVKINGHTFYIDSATEMYYDITDTLNVSDGFATVTINNIGDIIDDDIDTGSGILSVNNIKLTNTVAYAGLMSLNEEDLATVQYYANMEPVKSTVKNGVVTPVVEEEIPEDNTSTDNDNTNDDTNTEESEKEEFSIFSLLEMIISLIEKILYNAFGAGSAA